VPYPRILVILGSGETSPTMVTTHQRVFAALGTSTPAAFLDTPYGFQENADELGERIRTYFAESVGRSVEPVRFRSSAEAKADPAAHASEMARLLSARWIFAGPGSPSYALRQWVGSPVPGALKSLLVPNEGGGAVVFASAAALTLGLVTVPVYEIYKVGETPQWLPGLDVLGTATGLRAAVIPHFDNTEGGTHDTRYCYLGERRLAMLETSLPADAFVLGIDEHTGLVIDLDEEQAEVVGKGSVTVRTSDAVWRCASGDTVTLDALADHGATTRRVDPRPERGPTDGTATYATFDAALSSGDPRTAGAALIELDADASTPSAREAVRAGVARLADYAADAPVDRAGVLAPAVELLLELRASARNDKRFGDADLIRDRIAALGVEVRDTVAGVEWELRG
jgi:cyanophycinase-like exopeptidase